MLADYFHIPPAERDAFLSFARGRTDDDQGPRTKDQRIREFRPSSFVSDRPSNHNPQPAPSPPTAHPNNLPVQLTSFVGRAVELPRIRDLMLTSEVRLLTLTGPPGTGKTRLALQVAAELLEEFTDGVFFVNLAPITDPSLAISEIAQTLGVGESRGKSLLEGVRAYLGDRRVLLVLDNFEQVVEAALMVGELLRAAPGLKVMVTSRVPLHIRGEKEFSVPPLHVPDLQHLPSLERLGWYEAVRLFTERATDVSADFELTTDNASAVAHICAQPGRAASCYRAGSHSRKGPLSASHSEQIGEQAGAAHRRGQGPARLASRRCARPSSGVTTFSPTRRRSSSAAWRFSRAGVCSRQSRRCATPGAICR